MRPRRWKAPTCARTRDRKPTPSPTGCCCEPTSTPCSISASWPLTPHREHLGLQAARRDAVRVSFRLPARRSGSNLAAPEPRDIGGHLVAIPLSRRRSVTQTISFACTFTRHFPPVLVVLRSLARLKAGGAGTYTQRAIPGSEPRQDSCTLAFVPASSVCCRLCWLTVRMRGRRAGKGCGIKTPSITNY